MSANAAHTAALPLASVAELSVSEADEREPVSVELSVSEPLDELLLTPQNESTLLPAAVTSLSSVSSFCGSLSLIALRAKSTCVCAALFTSLGAFLRYASKSFSNFLKVASTSSGLVAFWSSALIEELVLQKAVLSPSALEPPLLLHAAARRTRSRRATGALRMRERDMSLFPPELERRSLAGPRNLVSRACLGQPPAGKPTVRAGTPPPRCTARRLRLDSHTAPEPSPRQEPCRSQRTTSSSSPLSTSYTKPAIVSSGERYGVFASVAMSSRSAAAWSSMDRNPSSAPVSERSSSSVTPVRPHLVCCITTAVFTPSTCTPRARLLSTSSVTRPPALRRTCASPRWRPSAANTSMRASMHVRIARWRLGRASATRARAAA